MNTFNPNSAGILAGKPAEIVSQQWFAAYTFSCQEKRVAQHLSARSIEFFLPTYRKLSRWKNGLRVPIDRPLFPGYVFVKIERNDRVRILELPGVHSIVGAGREPIPLPGPEIEGLRQGIHLLSAEPHPFLKAGEKVIVRNGPLQGMTGIVVRQKNSARIILTLDLIMRSISVEVDERDLEVVGPARRPCGRIYSFDSSRANAMPQQGPEPLVVTNSY